jgi:hypothetical protein
MHPSMIFSGHNLLIFGFLFASKSESPYGEVVCAAIFDFEKPAFVRAARGVLGMQEQAPRLKENMYT